MSLNNILQVLAVVSDFFFKYRGKKLSPTPKKLFFAAKAPKLA